MTDGVWSCTGGGSRRNCLTCRCNFNTVSPPVPFSIRALALSHARAWPTAAWTGIATALAAGLALLPAQWVLLIGLTALSGGAIRMISVPVIVAVPTTRSPSSTLSWLTVPDMGA